MCLIPNCHGTSAPQTKTWGLRTGLCPFHYDGMRNHITKNGQVSYAGNEGLLDDFIKIKALMVDKETVMSCMKQLDGELRSSAGQFREGALPGHDSRFGPRAEADQHYVRLSRALEYYEGMVWFPAVHVLFIGALTANDFLGYLTRLYMAKDPGAGAQHGDFTHRLQWHAITRVATKNFSTPLRAGWHHSPLELYRAMGEQLALTSAIGGIWGWALDNNFGVAYDCPMRTGRNQQVRTYGAPAEFHAELRARTDTPMLTRALERRFAKRHRGEEAARAALDSFWLEFASAGLNNTIPKPEVADIANQLYTWKKTTGPGVRAIDASTLRPHLQVLNGLSPMDKSYKKLRPRPEYQFLLEAAAYRLWVAKGMRPGGAGHYVVGPTLIDQLLGPVMHTRNERQVTEEEVRTRLALSRRQFDTTYRYAPSTGVRKLFASS